MPTDRVIRRTGSRLRKRDLHLATAVARATVLELLGSKRSQKGRSTRSGTEAGVTSPTIALASLTPRERGVAELLAAGKTNGDVATSLGISDRTVEVHRSRIYGKFGVSTARGFWEAAGRAGLVPAAASPGVPLDKLTDKERQVMDAILRGETDRDFAASFGVSRRTVEAHRRNLYRKLGVSHTGELFRLMQSQGLSAVATVRKDESLA